MSEASKKSPVSTPQQPSNAPATASAAPQGAAPAVTRAPQGGQGGPRQRGRDGQDGRAARAPGAASGQPRPAQGGEGRAPRQPRPEGDARPPRADGERGGRGPRLTPEEAAARAAEAAFRNPIPPITFPEDLPVSGRRAEIAEALTKHQVIIVSGETGSGKTTQLPKICLELGLSLIHI